MFRALTLAALLVFFPAAGAWADDEVPVAPSTGDEAKPAAPEADTTPAGDDAKPPAPEGGAAPAKAGDAAAGEASTQAPTVAPSGPPPMSSEEWWSQALGLAREPIVCAPRAPVPCWGGSATARFRGRYGEGESDNDLYEYFRVRYRREEADGWSGSMFLRLSQDLDRMGDATSFFVFDSIDDTYDTWILARLYHLYANYRRSQGFVEQVRVGRQDVVAGDFFLVDGVHTTFRPSACSNARIYVFGGIPTHLYESSIEGDYIFGGGVSFDTWRGATVELSEVYLQDENEIYGRKEANLATAQLTQSLGTRGCLRGGFQMLGVDPRLAWASADYFPPGLDATIRGTFRTQILAEKAQAYDIDPYYAILLELEPYWEAGASVSKEFGCRWGVEVGGQLRRLYDQTDRGQFNHDFSRLYATLSREDWPVHGLGAALTGEWWNAEDGEDIASAGFAFEWKPGGRWRASAGVDYALYRTDLYAADERYDSYGVFLRGRWRLAPCWELDSAVRVDFDDYDTYLTLNVALRFEF